MSEGFKPHGPNCGITALSIFLRRPFEEVWETYRTIAGKRTHWQGRTHTRHRDAVIAHYGVRVTIQDMQQTIRLWQLAKRTEDLDSKAILLVETTGHVQVVCRGMVFDQTTNGAHHWSYFWGRNKLVGRVIREGDH